MVQDFVRSPLSLISNVDKSNDFPSNRIELIRTSLLHEPSGICDSAVICRSPDSFSELYSAVLQIVSDSNIANNNAEHTRVTLNACQYLFFIIYLSTISHLARRATSIAYGTTEFYPLILQYTHPSPLHFPHNPS